MFRNIFRGCFRGKLPINNGAHEYSNALLLSTCFCLCFRGSTLTHPYPYRGGGRGGQNQPVEFHFFLLGNPRIVIHPLEWNCIVTFLNKPWALVRKYLRLAPEELSASMITAAQFFGGMPSLHMCCFSLTCA